VLVQTLGWRSIFFVNLPFGALGFAVLATRYHDSEKPHSTDLDLPGTGVLAVACTAILGLASGMGPGGWSWNVVALLAVVAIVSTALFIRIERQANNPIMPLELFTSPAIGPAMIGSALMGIAFFSVDTFVPLYVQGTTGAGATAAAGVVTPIMLSWGLSGIAVAPLIVRWGFRRTALVGAVLIVVSFSGLLICALAQASGWILAAVLVLSGLGFGATSMTYLLAVQHSVVWQQRGIATSSIQFFRTMGGAIGIGMLGMLFNVLAAAQMSQLRAMGVNPGTVLDPHTRSQLPAEVVEITSSMIEHGLTWVFAGMLFCAVLQLLVTLGMAKNESSATVTEVEAIEALPG
jgi:MFS family permease